MNWISITYKVGLVGIRMSGTLGRWADIAQPGPSLKPKKCIHFEYTPRGHIPQSYK